jgi:hypothetical protein
MKYAVKTGSDAMIYTYIPSFIQIGSGIQKLMEGGVYTDTKIGRRSHSPTLGKQDKSAVLQNL